jgi:hypothetical protein
MKKAKSSKRKEWIRKHKPKFYRREEKPLGKNDFEEAVKVVKMEFPNSYIVIDRKDKTITVGKGYEQGKKDQAELDRKDGNKYPTFAFEREFRKMERKQTLEEVQKKFINCVEHSDFEDWLEEELRRLSK